MERPTKKITLPISKKEVEIVEYFTRGESMEVQKILLGDSTYRPGESPAFTMDASFRSRDKAVEIAVKNMDMEEINNLPREDAEFLEAEVNKLSQPKKK